jgi:hypothetical protein
LNLILTVVLVRRYGLIGVAAAPVIASVVVDLCAMPLLAQRALGLTVLAFLRRACMRPLVVGVALAVLMTGVRLLGRPENWSALILQGALAGTGAMVVVLSLGITAAERRRFVLHPLERLLKGRPSVPEVGCT